jgi:hypothetical protein
MGMIRYITPDLEGTGFYYEFLARMALSPHIDKIIRKIITLFLRPKDEREILVKATTWKTCLLRMVDKLKIHPLVCLQAINCFFEMIEGKMLKPNLSFHSNIDVTVQWDCQEKTIVLPRNNTIFRLRKQIMQ